MIKENNINIGGFLNTENSIVKKQIKEINDRIEKRLILNSNKIIMNSNSLTNEQKKNIFEIFKKNYFDIQLLFDIINKSLNLSITYEKLFNIFIEMIKNDNELILYEDYKDTFDILKTMLDKKFKKKNFINFIEKTKKYLQK